MVEESPYDYQQRKNNHGRKAYLNKDYGFRYWPFQHDDPAGTAKRNKSVSTLHLGNHSDVPWVQNQRPLQ